MEEKIKELGQEKNEEKNISYEDGGADFHIISGSPDLENETLPDMSEEEGLEFSAIPGEDPLEDPLEDPQAGTIDVQNDDKLRGIYARAEVAQVDTLLSLVVHMITGEDKAALALSSDEKAALTAATEARIQAYGYALSPMQMYFAALGAVAISTYDKAVKSKKGREEAEKRRKAFEIVDKQHSGKFTEEEVREAKQEIQKKKKEPRRNDFSIDAQGYYRKDVRGKNIKGEKTEKPSPEILALIKSGEDKQVSQRTINETIRVHLYGKKAPVRNT